MKSSNKYQIFEKPEDSDFTAGGKAVEDVYKIAKRLNFSDLVIPVLRGDNFLNKAKKQYRFYRAWQKIYTKVQDHDILLFQYPSYEKQINRTYILKKLKKEKKIKLIFVIHDINALRNTKDSRFYFRFNDMLGLADKIIVHNSVMKNYFVSLNVSPNKIINLKIFDYLIDNYEYKKSTFSKTVNIAGNLSVNKSKYLEDLYKINTDFSLFGPNFKLRSATNIRYNGTVEPEVLPLVLNTGYGLVWDGDSIDTCKGMYGNYLKYNNPHKLSLYIASNLPIIIWKEAAEAKFVSENKIGILIDSLNELPKKLNSITEKEYDQYCTNIKKVATKIAHGNYMESAINTAVAGIVDNN